MKIERIENNKIKVTLSAHDLIDMDISVKSLTPSSPTLTGFLHEVLEQVSEETGFNPFDGQVMVEATPEEDGIVLVVTKLAPEKPKKRKIKNVRVRAVKKNLSTYKFSEFIDLTHLFRATNPENFIGGNLYDYQGNFYMVIPKDAVKNICEFAEDTTDSALSENFLEEHGGLKVKGAELVRMAKGINNL